MSALSGIGEINISVHAMLRTTVRTKRLKRTATPATHSARNIDAVNYVLEYLEAIQSNYCARVTNKMNTRETMALCQLNTELIVNG